VRAKLTEFYRSQGIRTEEVESKVGEHFIWIGKSRKASAKEAKEMESLRRFNSAEGLLVLLALAGVNIKGFLEGVKKGMVMCREKNVNNNPGAQLLILQEVMKKAGRNRVFLVLPEELKEFVKAWRVMISLTGREDRGIIPILEGELASPESYGKNTAFIYASVGATFMAPRFTNRGSMNRSPTVGLLKKAGYPVFELPLRRQEDFGALFYSSVLASAGSYLMGIDRVTRVGGVETLSPPEAVASRLKNLWPGRTRGSGIARVLRTKYPDERKGANNTGTEVILFDVGSFLEIGLVEEVTPVGMNRVFKVKPRRWGGRVLEFMEKIVKAAKEAENIDRVQFVFVSSKKGVNREVMDKMLRYYMSAYGLSTDMVDRMIDSNFIIDEKELRDAGAIGGRGILRTSRIDTRAVFSIINERLQRLGWTPGDAKITIITDNMNRWKQDKKMRERILWVLLNPVEEGRVVSTTGGLVITIEGEVCEWLRKFIEDEYSEEEAKRLWAEIIRDGKVILPLRDEKHLDEKMWFPEMTFRIEA